MYLRLFEKRGVSSTFKSWISTMEESMNPLKSYAKCWMNTYVFTYMYIFLRMSSTFIKFSKDLILLP